MKYFCENYKALAKNKLRKFQQLDEYYNVFQPKIEQLDQEFSLKGKWHTDFFKNKNPIVLELGCGKGEYSVGLAKKYPNKNFIGVDVKGARMWTGATEAIESSIDNVAFLRTRIEFVEQFFSSDEVDEIWITFPDPQIKKRRSRNRLTHPIFLNRYRSFLKKDGCVHLKTDSLFLHGYTLGVIEGENHILEETEHDIYGSLGAEKKNLEIKTYYERLFLAKAMPITYLRFRLTY
jgi:tRNA (guanine-N7-)-methyltransferase